MNKRQLLYFAAVAEEGNITKAAERLHIPQPYLSNQLKIMEADLGVKLAERSTRKFQLTDAGRRLQYRASQILDLMDITGQELGEFESGYQGTLKVGTTATPASILLPHKLHQFHLQYPRVQIEVQTMRPAPILESIKVGLIEIGLLRTPIDPDAFHSINLPAHPMVAVAAKGTFDGYPEDFFDLSVLSGKALLISCRLESPICEACRNAGFRPSIFCRIDDTRTILICASLGMGVTIVPKDWLNIIPGLAFDYRELNIASLNTSSALIWAKNRRLSSAAKNFLHLYSSGIV